MSRAADDERCIWLMGLMALRFFKQYITLVGGQGGNSFVGQYNNYVNELQSTWIYKPNGSSSLEAISEDWE